MVVENKGSELCSLCSCNEDVQVTRRRTGWDYTGCVIIAIALWSFEHTLDHVCLMRKRFDMRKRVYVAIVFEMSQLGNFSLFIFYLKLILKKSLKPQAFLRENVLIFWKSDVSCSNAKWEFFPIQTLILICTMYHSCLVNNSLCVLNCARHLITV